MLDRKRIDMLKKLALLMLITTLCLSLSVSVSANNTKLVAMTFEDGPSETYTNLLLDSLAERNVRVTFFFTGQNVELYPKTAERAFDEGHQLGSHTYSHQNLSRSSTNVIKSEIDSTDELLEKITGQKVHMVRPPFGSITSTARKSVNAPFIQWSVEPTNGNVNCGENYMLENLLKSVRDGSIIKISETSSRNINVAIDAIDILLDEGYEFVTVSELFRLRGIMPENGSAYYSLPNEDRATEYTKETLEEHWACPFIQFVSTNGIMTGDDSGFCPEGFITRAMAATFLWRMSGCPDCEYMDLASIEGRRDNQCPFEDVSPDDFFYTAVNWAASSGYVDGISATEFAPLELVTKQQFYVLLYRYAKNIICESTPCDAPAYYRDDVRISDWAGEGVSAIRGTGFFSLNDREIFRPLDYITRAEVAELITWFMRDYPSSLAVRLQIG